jgi:hypothetical protein
MHECHWVCDKAASEQPKKNGTKKENMRVSSNSPKIPNQTLLILYSAYLTSS